MKKQRLIVESITEPSLSLAVPKDDPAEQLQQFLSSNNKVYKFVLTGGPCSGKTTAMERLQVFLRERGTILFDNSYDCFFINYFPKWLLSLAIRKKNIS